MKAAEEASGASSIGSYTDFSYGQANSWKDPFVWEVPVVAGVQPAVEIFTVVASVTLRVFLSVQLVQAVNNVGIGPLGQRAANNWYPESPQVKNPMEYAKGSSGANSILNTKTIEEFFDKKKEIAAQTDASMADIMG